MPFAVLAGLVYASAFLSRGFANAALVLTPRGRLILNRTERSISWVVAVSLTASAALGVFAWLTGSKAALGCLVLTIPCAVFGALLSVRGVKVGSQKRMAITIFVIVMIAVIATVFVVLTTHIDPSMRSDT